MLEHTLMHTSSSARRAALPLAIALILSACGDDHQDRSWAPSKASAISGVAIDGHIARARAYIDQDNNGLWDPWEPSAITDTEGFFSFNPHSGVDYCALPESPHCLRTSRDVRDAVLRVAGGYDLLTGEPSSAELSRRLDATAATVPQVISPLTSLLTEVSNDQQPAALLGLGLDADDLNVDYLAGEGDPTLFKAALTVHKVVSVLADQVQANYLDVGERSYLPASAGPLVYKFLSRRLQAGDTTLTTLLGDVDALGEVDDQVRRDLNARYAARALPVPTVGSRDAILVATRIPALVETLVKALPAETDQRGRARALEAVVQKAVGRGTRDALDMLDYLMDPARREVLEALIEQLGARDADLPAVVRRDFAQAPYTSPEEVRQSVRLPQSAEAFKNLPGSKVRISDLDLGEGPDNLRDIELEVHFSGQPDASDGRFTACVKVIDGAHADGRLGEGNTRGERVTGNWSLMDGSSGESYSLLLSIQYLGGDYQAIMKPAGTVAVEGSPYTALRFDYAGDFRTWHSRAGFEAAGTPPRDNADCKRLLPSRVGLS